MKRLLRNLTPRVGMARLLVGSTLLALLPATPIQATPHSAGSRLARLAPSGKRAPAPAPVQSSSDAKTESEPQTPVEAEALPPGFVINDGRAPEAVAVTPAGGNPTLEAEPNNTTATANPLAGGYAKVTGILQPANETDFYSFTATAGDRVYAATQTAFGGVSDTAGLTTDSVLALVASNGTTVIETDDNDGTFGASASTIAGATIPTTGTYFLRVRGNSATSEIAPYDLYLRVQSGAPTPEVENNNLAGGTPNPLPNSGWVSGVVSAAADTDTFSLTLNAGDTAFLSLDADPERNATTFNPRVSFGGFDGFILPVNDASVTSPNSEAGFFTVKDSGTYFVVVDATAGAGAAATYNLSVGVIPANSSRTCTTFTSTDVPKTVGPNPALTQSTIVVPASPARRIGNLAVSINLTHPFVSDLDVSLVGPDGDEVMLFDDPTDVPTGATAPQIDTVFDDEAGIPVTSFNVYKGVRATPEGQGHLAWFRGELAAGTWTLNVRDDFAGDGGTLNAWSLIVCEDPIPTACSGTTTTVYSNDFEANDGGFTHNGVLDEWELGTPTGAPVASANSGTRAWETDLDNTYENSSSQNLVSPTINLAPYAGQSVVFEWAMKHQIESSAFDNAFVEVREVGGAAAVRRVWEWAGPTQQRSANVGNPAVTIPSATGWSLYRADITQFAGLPVQLVFHLDSDVSFPFDGMGVDDVRVTACSAAAPDVAIAKSGPASVACNDTVTYMLTASNVGTADAVNAAVTDDLPDCLTGVTVSSPVGTFSVGAGNVVSGTIPTLTPGSQVTITISGTAPATCGASISNQATISAAGDTNSGNNTSATVTTTVTTTGSCSLVPMSDSNPILTSHTVTLTVLQCGAPQSGQAVTFAVAGRNTASGSGTTDASGQATFTYTDAGSPVAGGSDTITATVVSTGGTCTATKDWVATPCTLTCSANVTQSNDKGQCGAVVDYPATTSTGSCGTITCTPPAGSFFPVGTTTVTCTAQSGASCSFTVTVNDTQAPTVTCPANVTTATAPNTCAATVSYATPTASDNCPGATVSCLPASGSSFPKGTTTVTCTATDAAGLTGSCSFTVTVNDMQPPTITCPANVVTPAAQGTCAATVTYAPTSSDNCAGGSVVCVPASGSSFPKGTTSVSCTATDAAGNTATCGFTVTVTDTQPPTITCPANITTGANATMGNQTGANVTYPAPTVSDNCPGAAAPVCTPASGSFFPTGTTTVTCTVTDAAALSASCSFTVTVASGFTNCYVDDATGDTLSIVADPASPLYRMWQYRVAATGQVFTGSAEYLSLYPGRSLIAYDHDNSLYVMDLSVNFGSNTATATVTRRAGNVRFTLRDRNITNNPPCQ